MLLLQKVSPQNIFSRFQSQIQRHQQYIPTISSISQLIQFHLNSISIPSLIHKTIQNLTVLSYIIQQSMIRPSVAPIKKNMHQPEFSVSFTPTNTDKIIMAKLKTEIQNKPSLSSNNSEPVPTILQQYQKQHSRQKPLNGYLGIQSLQSFRLDSKIKQHIEQSLQKMLQPLMSKTKNQLLELRKEVEDLKTSTSNMLKKNKFDSEETIRKAISNILTSNITKPTEDEPTEIKTKLNNLQSMFSKVEKQHCDAIQKAYTQIKQLTNIVTVLSERVQNLQCSPHQVVSSLAFFKKTPQSKMKMISEIKEQVGSKVDSIGDPSSIISGYEGSVNMTPQSQIRQQAPSILKGLSFQQQRSEMIMVDSEGEVTDIKGMPIIDRNGNLLVMNLKQIKHLLYQNFESK